MPGTVRGRHEALSRYGSKSWRQVLAPAIGVATNGFTVSQPFHRLNTENEKKFRAFNSTSALYLKGGKALPAGTLLRNPDLARAYGEIAARGPKAFYQGTMARALVDAVNAPRSRRASRCGRAQ